MDVIIYADGACPGNPGPGGWGAVVISGGSVRELSGSVLGVSTNQRMEIIAAIESLRTIKYPANITFYTDSVYVVSAMNEYITGWIIRGWRNPKLKLIENKDLWLKLLKISSKHKITWNYIKGHNDHPYQERANELAQAAARGRKEVVV